MKMHDNTKLLYQIIYNLQKLNAPIVIKGGLALKAALNKNHADIDRKTIDIDADWLQKPPDMNKMQKYLNKAAKMINPSYSACITRNFTDNQSAGLRILDEYNQPIIKADIDVNKTPNIEIYRMHGITFRGSAIEEMLADKITAVSTRNIFRRTKDILDIYAIDKYIAYDKNKLIKCLSKRNIGSFTEFTSNKDMIEHAYNKLRGIENKPEFNTVYQHVIQLCKNVTTEKQSCLQPNRHKTTKRRLPKLPDGIDPETLELKTTEDIQDNYEY